MRERSSGNSIKKKESSSEFFRENKRENFEKRESLRRRSSLRGAPRDKTEEKNNDTQKWRHGLSPATIRQQFVLLRIIIFDALDGCSIHDCTVYDTSDSSGSGSTLCDPVIVAGERRNYHRQTRSSSAVTIRHRYVHRGSSKDWSSVSSFDSECDEINDTTTNSERRHMIHRNLKENENLDLNQGSRLGCKLTEKKSFPEFIASLKNSRFLLLLLPFNFAANDDFGILQQSFKGFL